MFKNIKYIPGVLAAVVLLGFKSNMDKVYIKTDKQHILQVTIGKKQYQASLQTDKQFKRHQDTGR